MTLDRWTVVLVALLGLMAADVFAQLGSIRGKFVDESGNPIADIECEIELAEGKGRRSNVETKENGEFVKGGVRPGNYVVRCKKEGLRPVALPAVVSAFDQANLGEIVMYPLAPGELSEEDHARATALLEEFNVAAESGDNEETLQKLLELKELMPESTEIDFNIAGTYEKMGKKDEAIDYYAKAAEVNPALAYDSWLAIADLHGKDREWAEAAVAMGEAMDIKATDPVAVFNYAVYQQNAGDAAGAKAAYEKTIEIDPAREMAYYQLGMIAVGNTENEAAIGYLEKFLEIAPDHPQAGAAKDVIEALKAKESQP